ncbi:hypothetical protein [Oscillibacter sp.]|uniref:hypothetical protein n=1 Tax=Oscillibacter sp. TaxID=1945593 RepID=UPI002897FB1D|nr:hypothetical protein [Oscillibacter sp.]
MLHHYIALELRKSHGSLSAVEIQSGPFSDKVFSLAVHTYTELESVLPGIEKVQI